MYSQGQNGNIKSYSCSITASQTTSVRSMPSVREMPMGNGKELSALQGL